MDHPPPEPYRWDSADYARNSATQFAWAQELLTKLRLRGDESVLDIGCGDGKITALIAKSVPRGRVTGIDRSPDMIALARTAFPAAEHPNLDFEEMDAGHLRYDREFDVAFSNAVLHWLRDHKPFLRGLGKSLKLGGRVLLQMGGRGNARDILAVVDELIRSPRWTSFFTGFDFRYGFYGPQEYTAWLMEAGLLARRIELIPKDMKQPNREGLAGWIRTTWLPYTERVPVQLRGAFIDDTIDAYLRNRPADADGTIHVAMVRLEVEAVAG